MWKEGIIGIPTDIAGKFTAVHYWVKHYAEPSEFGINSGRISKLTMKIGNEVVCNYDRGWDISPTCKAAEAALQILLYEIDGRSDE